MKIYLHDQYGDLLDLDDDKEYLKALKNDREHLYCSYEDVLDLIDPDHIQPTEEDVLESLRTMLEENKQLKEQLESKLAYIKELEECIEDMQEDIDTKRGYC